MTARLRTLSAVLLVSGALGLSDSGSAVAATDVPAPGSPVTSAPLVTPLHDADILYRLAGPPAAQMHQRMRWSSASWRQRIDPEGAGTIMLTDYRLHELMVLNTTDKTATVTEAPGSAFAPPGTPAPGAWRQIGPATIAGESCMIWESADTDNHPTDFCYTTDGLLLGATQSGRLVVQAVSVSRSPQPTELFEPPPGYRKIEPGR